MPDRPRNLAGYGRTPPHANWPGGARVAVSFVLNYEEGAERTPLNGDPVSETFLHEIMGEARTTRDYSTESIYEFGSKVGVWRVLDAFDEVQLPLTMFACGQAVELNPAPVTAAAQAGHEICSHGYRWFDYADVPEDVERDHIRRTIAAIETAAGERPYGWYTGRFSPNTRRLVAEEGGFLYDSDDYSDDLPFATEVSGKKHLVIPYSFDTNDMHYHQGFHRFVTARDFADYTTDAFDTLWAEGERSPKMMSIGLHLRMIGRPGRIAALDRIVGHMKQKGGAWFATRRQIAEHWLARF